MLSNEQVACNVMIALLCQVDNLQVPINIILRYAMRMNCVITKTSAVEPGPVQMSWLKKHEIL